MKRVLVTGANKGIGKALVRAILKAREDTAVLLGSRDEGRGRAARDDLVAADPRWAARLTVLPLDVADDASVAAAAEAVRAAHPEGALHGLVNNAGIGLDGEPLRAILEVNTYGVRRVCEAFLPLLERPGGRVVNVTSASGPHFVTSCRPERQRFFLDPGVTWAAIEALLEECLALEGPEAFAAAGLGSGNAYGLSKAATNAYTVHLARENPGLHVNACTPGFIATDLTRPHREGSGRSAAELGMKPPAAGTKAPLHLLFGDLEGNGRYYGSDAVRSPMHRYRSPGDPPYTGEP